MPTGGAAMSGHGVINCRSVENLLDAPVVSNMILLHSFISSFHCSGGPMESSSTSVRSTPQHLLRLVAAASLAALAVWFAWHQISALAKPAEYTGPLGTRPIRPIVPEFWLRDHAAARAQAQTTGKPIFLVIRCEP
jgi:hypothetical protein